MRKIENSLIGGVGMYGRHQTMSKTELIAENLHYRRKTVSRAACVRNNVVAIRIVAVLIHPEDDRHILILTGRRNNYLPRAGLYVFRR